LKPKDLNLDGAGFGVRLDDVVDAVGKELVVVDSLGVQVRAWGHAGTTSGGEGGSTCPSDRRNLRGASGPWWVWSMCLTEDAGEQEGGIQG